MDRDRPIGVFDSGVGGLSILRALRAELPREEFVYFSDAGHAPYGEKGEAFVCDRSLAIAVDLLERKGVAFTEIEAAFDPEKRQEMMQRSGRATFPQIFIGERHIGGCDDMMALEREGKLDPLLQAA